MADYSARCARIMAICRESSALGNQIKGIEDRKASLFAELESLMPDHLRDTDAFIAAMRRPK